MADYDEEIPAEEKVQIAKDFLSNAPPGEFNEVFNDVRVLLNDDGLLRQAGEEAFSQYNEDQFMVAKVDGDDVLVTEHGKVGENKYSHPSKGKTFGFDHLRREVQDISSGSSSGNETLRVAVESALAAYLKNHYPEGISTVYARGNDVIACIEDHKYQPHNFWNGKWRASWKLDTSSGIVEGVVRTQVHYYEDGNVQLNAKKEVNESLKVGGSDDETAAALIKFIEKAESDYQNAVAENYSTMSTTTFKALRRQLPVTRQKVDWNKILNYKIGQELSSKK
eukprot:m.134633 g.134633  ORF g.134633 m.134633 type:complete len:280 (+) comp9659_c0_seq1:95-934(+)